MVTEPTERDGQTKMRVLLTRTLLNLSKLEEETKLPLVVDQAQPHSKLIQDLKLAADQDPQTVDTMVETLPATFSVRALDLKLLNNNNSKAALLL